MVLGVGALPGSKVLKRGKSLGANGGHVSRIQSNELTHQCEQERERRRGREGAKERRRESGGEGKE